MQYLTVQFIKAFLNSFHFLMELLEMPVDQRPSESEWSEPTQKGLPPVAFAKIFKVGCRFFMSGDKPMIAHDECDRVVGNARSGQIESDEFLINRHALSGSPVPRAQGLLGYAEVFGHQFDNFSVFGVYIEPHQLMIAKVIKCYPFLDRNRAIGAFCIIQERCGLQLPSASKSLNRTRSHISRL